MSRMAIRKSLDFAYRRDGAMRGRLRRKRSRFLQAVFPDN
jgi:hypothetical protein